MRRLLASTAAATPAVHAALGHLNHPVGLLTTPPLRLPHRGMEGAMEAFAAVGAAYVEAGRGARLGALVHSTFQRHGLRGGEQPAGVAIGWDPQYLGKGTASVHGKVAWTSVAAELWSAAFRTLCPSGSTPCCRRCAACGSTRRSTSRSTSSTRRPGSRSRSTGRTRSRSSARRSPTRPPAS